MLYRALQLQIVLKCLEQFRTAWGLVDWKIIVKIQGSCQCLLALWTWWFQTVCQWCRVSLSEGANCFADPLLEMNGFIMIYTDLWWLMLFVLLGCLESSTRLWLCLPAHRQFAGSGWCQLGCQAEQSFFGLFIDSSYSIYYELLRN